jgi:hypothetical protein
MPTSVSLIEINLRQFRFVVTFALRVIANTVPKLHRTCSRFTSKNTLNKAGWMKRAARADLRPDPRGLIRRAQFPDALDHSRLAKGKRAYGSDTSKETLKDQLQLVMLEASRQGAGSFTSAHRRAGRAWEGATVARVEELLERTRRDHQWPG